MAFDDTSSTANAVFSLRLGHGTALALSTQFTTVPPLRYLPEGGFLLTPLYHKSAEKTSVISAEIYVCP